MGRQDRVKANPSPYPALVFHGLRTAQVISALIVTCVIAYFMRELKDAGYGMPWTFILLLITAILTLVLLPATYVLYPLTGFSPSPVLNAILNSILLVLWVVAFGMLTRFSARPVLSQQCSKSIWDMDMGVMVCRLYKALYSFCVLGVVATIGALGLDIYVQRSSTSRGKFAPIGGEKGAHVRVQEEPAYAGGYSDAGGHSYAHSHEDVSGVGNLDERNPNPMMRGANRGGDRQGYAPVEGGMYDEDTEYRGASGRL